jgi:CheY-like chemotaxis protein
VRIRILRRPHGRVSGIRLDRFEPGALYDVDATTADLLVAEGWGQRVADQAPALVIPLADDTCKPIVLVIDDDRQTRMMLTAMLSLEGYAVESAADGAEGLSRMTQPPPPALILLDLKMPRMTGEEFRQAQNLLPPPAPGIPVVIVSGQDDAALQSRRLKAVDYITKPIDDSALLRAVRSHCGPPRTSRPH